MPSHKHNKYRRGLPEATSSDVQYYCIPIPTDKQYRAAWLGAFQKLGNETSWDKELTGKRFEVAAWWDNYAATLPDLMSECSPPSNCRTFTPPASRISYYPCSPFLEGCELPDEYTFEPFTVVGSGNISEIIGVWGFGYQVGDVYTDLTKMPELSLDTVLSGFEFWPHITVTTPPGDGTVKIKFLNIPQGGRALVTLDGDFLPLSGRLIELNKDLVSIPPETSTPQTYDLEVTGEGEHTIVIYFLPTLDDTFIPLFFGGGIRSIEMCGFDFGGCMDDPCCPDEIIAIDNMHDTMKAILKVLEGGWKLVPNVSSLTPPDLSAGDCAPAYFDHDTDETEPEVLAQRQKALCITVQRYIKAIMLNSLVDMGAPEILRDWVRDQFAADVPDSLLKVEVRYFPLFEGIAAFLAAMTAEVSIDLIACEMISKLQGDNINSFTFFRISLSESYPESIGVPLQPLYDLVRKSNDSKDNYLAFNEALHEANEEDLSAYECPCELVPPGECETITLVNANPVVWPDLVLTLVDAELNIWRIENPTTDSTGFGVYGAAIKDENGCCFNLAAADGYTLQGMAQHKSYDCAGVAGDLTVGGAIPIDCISQLDWDLGTGGAIDTYFQVTPADLEECP